jgi:type II secretory ATPase GspE/PulE/Tfp pilus assembly ATPase PilB-like protein
MVVADEPEVVDEAIVPDEPVAMDETVVLDEPIEFTQPVVAPVVSASDAADIPAVLTKLIEDSVRHRASEVLVELQGKKLLVRQRIRGVLVRCLNHDCTADDVQGILDGMEKWGPVHQVGNVTWLELSLERCHLVFSRTAHGGVITVRMSPSRETIFSPEAWGMGPHQARLLEGYLGRTQGLLLFCGMDQDDIESNLYACAKRIASPEKHVLCVSDKRGTWDTLGDQLVSDGDPNVMEKLLDLSFQHSPDVLIVGPVETRGQFERLFAQALKGTLVLAQTYARDTADALVQLLAMGLPPYLMGSALLGIISQRNLRLLCPHCQSEDAKAKDLVEQLSIPAAMLPPAFYTAKGCD